MELHDEMSRAPSADAFWAKLDATGQRWHPLIAHAADVAAVMERLLADDAPFAPRLAATIGRERLTPFVRSLLVQLAVMHDLGKANHGFQDRALPLHERTHQRQGHVGIALRAFGDVPVVHSTVVEALAPLAEVPDAVELLVATIAHHGKPVTTEHTTLGATAAAGSYWLPNDRRAPLQEILRLGEHARRWSGIDAYLAPAEPFATPAFTHYYAGLLNLADWVGSTEAAFPFHPEADEDPDAYWQQARARADSACRAIGLIPHAASRTLAPNPLPQLFPRVFGGQNAAAPTPVQHDLATGILPQPGERWVLEAATGSGKTEAALSLYARLRASGLVAGLMFALPTRATARAMHGRVSDLLHALHGSTAPSVTLGIGGVAPELRTAAAITSSDTIEYHNDDDEDARTSALTTWSTSDMRKYLSGEVVVGTIDQALLAALAVRFAHQRLACLSRHLLVIDEVHAHDDYVLETLRVLLDAHRSAGGIALLMSATLPSRALQRLAGQHPDSVPSLQESLDRPYPALSKLTPQRAWITTGYRDTAPSRDIHWSLTSESDALEVTMSAAHQGARVCVLRNTVRDAQATIDTLSSRGAENLLWRPKPDGPTPAYHARYAQPDREYLDTEILKAFGKDAANAGGVILTATQVIEQSLDVDFDLLITDLAPVEVVLQRIGRLHRHRRQHRPPGYEQPQALIIAPNPVDPNNERGPRGVGTVYRNLPALELTRRAILRAPTITLPSGYRALIEGAYHPDSVEQLRPEPGWAAAIERTYGTSDAHAFQARQVTLRFDRTYHDNHDRYRDEGRVRTRLGDDTQRLTLHPPAVCWYAPNAYAPTVELREYDLRGQPRTIDGTLEPAHGRRLPDGRTEYRLQSGVTLTYEPTGWRIQRLTQPT